MGDNLTEREIFRLTPQERTEIREARIREEAKEARIRVWEEEARIREEEARIREEVKEARFLALTREEKDEYIADLAALRGERYVR